MPGERTEQATQHRRQQARREGDILHSRELTSAAGTLAGVMMLGAVGTRSVEAWRASLPVLLELGRPQHWEPATVAPTAWQASSTTARPRSLAKSANRGMSTVPPCKCVAMIAFVCGPHAAAA